MGKKVQFKIYSSYFHENVICIYNSCDCDGGGDDDDDDACCGLLGLLSKFGVIYCFHLHDKVVWNIIF